MITFLKNLMYNLKQKGNHIMAMVSIPTANYVGREKKYSVKQDKFVRENLLLPKLVSSKQMFDQQTKLWRFYCTAWDSGCNNYKMEDFQGKNLNSKDKYLLWVKGWKEHYSDISNLIREYKKIRSEHWLNDVEQSDYRNRLERYAKEKTNLLEGVPLMWWHEEYVRERLDGLKRSAQHLLNARHTNKLASNSIVMSQRRNSK